MKKMGLLLGVVFLLMTGYSLADFSCSADNGNCCVCVGGDCQSRAGSCHCSCVGIGVFCHADNKPCAPPCPLAQAITPGALITFPWLATPRIAAELAKNSVVPDAGFVYFMVQATVLTSGTSSHAAFVGDPKQKKNDARWFNIENDEATRHSEVKIYYDADRVWETTDDMHHSKVRLPVTETVNFYEDHWEQVNANGKFTGKVEMAH